MPVDYTKYLEACRKASEDSEFENFRRNPAYNVVIEHVSYQLGMDYLLEVKKNTPDLIKYAYNFVTSEDAGNPIVYYYDIIGLYLSPTTCRYIKVLSDLIKMFGSLKIDIIEIGGGYGGQCKIIYDYTNPRSYTIIDLPEVLSLAGKFLDKFNIKPIFRDTKNQEEINYDLCISNYSFSEFDRRYQDFYAEKIIKKSRSGYMTCNFMGLRDSEGAFTAKELLRLNPNSEILSEVPKSANNNLIYIWNRTVR